MAPASGRKGWAAKRVLPPIAVMIGKKRKAVPFAAAADRISFAGPFTSDDGQTMIGSLLAIDFDSRDAAMEWLKAEPFTQAGLYASKSVQPFLNLWPQKTGFPQ